MKGISFGLLRYTRRILLALALILAIGAGAAASASANGDLVVTKGGNRSASDSSSGATTYASPVAGARFEYTTDNTLPQTGWIEFTNAHGRQRPCDSESAGRNLLRTGKDTGPRLRQLRTRSRALPSTPTAARRPL